MDSATANSNGVGDGAYTLKDSPIENLRPLKVRVIGAGFSGILAAIRLLESLTGKGEILTNSGQNT